MSGLARPLGYPVFRRLFAAQVLGLLGTGLSTIALTLLAYEVAGASAGVVIGVALAIKMVAYVFVAPVAAAWLDGRDPRRAMIALDLARIPLVASMAFVNDTWQIWTLIFLISACAAAFTPTFQATIPSVIDDDNDYVNALSLSRIAYELEVILSPLMAALLLGFVSFDLLFAADAMSFLLSALLIAAVVLPAAKPTGEPCKRFQSIAFGARVFAATPSLRGLMCLNLAVACASAMIIVNTVIFAKQEFGADDTTLALILAAVGAGSIVSALATPTAVRTVGERSTMLAGGLLAALALFAATGATGAVSLAVIWGLTGVGMGAVLTPVGRLLRRSAPREQLPFLFATQFSLSHACWLVTYPVAGVVGAELSVVVAALALGGMALLASLLAVALWRPENASASPRPAAVTTRCV